MVVYSTRTIYENLCGACGISPGKFSVPVLIYSVDSVLLLGIDLISCLPIKNILVRS